MSEHDHRPVTFAGVLLLTAVALIFLAIVWAVGAAFARTGIAFGPWNKLLILALS